MAENKLTDKSLRALKPTDKEQVLGDGGGLWIRVLPASKGGTINFYYRFEIQSKERRYNCGSYPETSLAQARDKRNAARNSVRLGVDPVDQEDTERTERTAAQSREKMEKTVQELFQDWQRVYLTIHRKDGGKLAEDFVEHDVLPAIGNMKAKDVKLANIVLLLDEIVKRGARRKANSVLSILRQMFRHGMARGLVETDPTLGLSKKHVGGKETPCDRNLSNDEISELATKLPTSGLHERMQASVWILLATGARVGELLKARWIEFDLDLNTWTIPATNSKNGKSHLVHLSAFALKHLKTLQDIKSGEYILPGRKPKMPISDKALSKALRDRIRSTPLKNRTEKTATLLLTGGEWTPHDLRRTMATRMGDLGVQPHVIERCLNHVQQGILGVYQRQEYLPERKDAYETWGKKLSSLNNSNTEN